MAFSYATIYARLDTQAMVRQKGIRYRGIYKVMQIPDHGHAKNQAEIQQTVQPVCNMKKTSKLYFFMCNMEITSKLYFFFYPCHFFPSILWSKDNQTVCFSPHQC